LKKDIQMGLGYIFEGIDFEEKVLEKEKNGLP
jgi:hypothetical protein